MCVWEPCEKRKHLGDGFRPFFGLKRYLRMLPHKSYFEFTLQVTTKKSCMRDGDITRDNNGTKHKEHNIAKKYENIGAIARHTFSSVVERDFGGDHRGLRDNGLMAGTAQGQWRRVTVDVSERDRMNKKKIGFLNPNIYIV